jgi:hypothetical protein
MFLPFRPSIERMSHLFAQRSRASRRSQRIASFRRRFLLEPLEGRQMLSTFYVSTTVDNGSNTSPAAGSLRAAILAVDAQKAGTYSTIDFNIPGTGVHQITPRSLLPLITNPVNINGLSESGSSAASPQIEINGAIAGADAFGLLIQPSASGTATNPTQISGLMITDFGGGGVQVNEASYVKLSDLFVGVSVLGTNTIFAAGNGVFGVFFAAGSNDSLSGSVVSANQGNGVDLGRASNDTLSGDFIGTDATGKGSVDFYGTSLANAASGVAIYAAASNNTIGGTVSGAADVISNNRQQGVWISDSGTSGNLVEGDKIGTTVNGTGALPNSTGVFIQNDATGNTVGGTTLAALDVISGNYSDGVHIEGGASSNLVEGDDIGVAYGGTASLGNGGSGAAIFGGASNNSIGASAAGAGNVISGNGQNGVFISDSTTTGNLVAGDKIGTNAAGTSAIPNGTGVLIQTSAAYNTIGGTTTPGTPSDVISGNYGDGVHIVGGAAHNWVEGDYIGVASNRTASLGNGASGVAIYGGASNNTIGVSAAGTGSGNVISGNNQNGVYISDSTTTGNLVAGDTIGTNAAGTSALPNHVGVFVGNGASSNIIGGTSATQRDLISGNAWDGVQLVGGGTSGNLVEGDYIGVASGGTSSLGNGASGVSIYGSAHGNTIGATAHGSGNVISGNAQNGVYIGDSGTNGNVVAGDYIGTDYLGTSAIPNGTGVFIQHAAYNTIGGTSSVPTPSDVISGNYSDGVHIVNGAFDNWVEGDFIGMSAYGSALGNGASGVAIYADSWNNTIGVNASGTGQGNVISANGQNGVYISDSGTNSNLVAGDQIGTDIGGGDPLPNATGVLIQNGAAYNTIGGTITATRDVISGNTHDGVDIAWGAAQNVVEGDYIGTNGGGTNGVGNGGSGVSIYGAGNYNTIGGNVSGSGDLISGNTSGDGVYIGGSWTNGNLVAGDYIGTDSTGSYSVPNYVGVVVTNSAAYNIIGGAASGAAPSDLISGNSSDGVEINWGAGYNVVVGDDIGVTASLGRNALVVPVDAKFKLANGASGVSMYGGASNNTIGGTTVSVGDIIAYNTQNGIYIGGSGTNGNSAGDDWIANNGNNGVTIASGATGNSIANSNVYSNTHNGVEVDANASYTTITYDALENNGASGVYFAPGSSENVVENCTIEYNTWGIYDAGSNNSQNSNILDHNTNGN